LVFIDQGLVQAEAGVLDLMDEADFGQGLTDSDKLVELSRPDVLIKNLNNKIMNQFGLEFQNVPYGLAFF